MSPRAEKQRPLQTTGGKKSKAVRDRDTDVTLGGEASTSISPDVNREPSRGGCASEGEATLPGQRAKSCREMEPPDAAGRCAGPGSTARGSTLTDWGGRARETAAARRGPDRAAGRGSGRRRTSGAEREHGRRASTALARRAPHAQPGGRSPGGWRRGGGQRTFRGPLAPRPARRAARGRWRRLAAGRGGGGRRSRSRSRSRPAGRGSGGATGCGSCNYRVGCGILVVFVGEMR